MSDRTVLLVNCIFVFGALLLVTLFEAALLSLSQSRSRTLRELGKTHAERWKLVRILRTNASFFLLSAQIGFFVSSLLLGGALAWFLHEHFPQAVLPESPLLRSIEIVVGLIGLGVVLWIPVHCIRLFASTYPEFFLLRLARFAYLSALLFSPATRILEALSALLSRLLPGDVPTERELAAPGEDIREIVELTGTDETLEEDEKEMIRGVFKLDETMLREIMTPRADIISINQDASFDELLRLFETEKLSRILITGDGLDDVRGVVHSKELLPWVLRDRTGFSISQVIRPACVLPGTKLLDDVLQEFKREGIHFAVVLDEHGGVDGVVTVEDLLEEIVGEIFDEFDSPTEDSLIQKTKSGDHIVDGSASISDCNEQLGLNIPEGEYDTIAGFLLQHLGRIPNQGEIVEIVGRRIRIEQRDANRLISLRLIATRRNARQARTESKASGSESKSFEVSKEPKAEGY